MVMGGHMKAAASEIGGEAGVPRGMFGQAMMDLNHAQRLSFGFLHMQAQARAAGALKSFRNKRHEGILHPVRTA